MLYEFQSIKVFITTGFVVVSIFPSFDLLWIDCIQHVMYGLHIFYL